MRAIARAPPSTQHTSRHGRARPLGGAEQRGAEQHGKARQGTARHSKARHGAARHGAARHGAARQGTAHSAAQHGRMRAGLLPVRTARESQCTAEGCVRTSLAHSRHEVHTAKHWPLGWVTTLLRACVHRGHARQHAQGSKGASRSCHHMHDCCDRAVGRSRPASCAAFVAVAHTSSWWSTRQ